MLQKKEKIMVLLACRVFPQGRFLFSELDIWEKYNYI